VDPVPAVEIDPAVDPVPLPPAAGAPDVAVDPTAPEVPAWLAPPETPTADVVDLFPARGTIAQMTKAKATTVAVAARMRSWGGPSRSHIRNSANGDTTFPQDRCNAALW
jgi:hypothetical protein